MTTNQQSMLRKLKALNLAEWQATFWLVKRRPVNRQANYTVLRVDMDAKLAKRLRGYVRQQLQTRDFHLTPYEYENADTDDVLLTLEADATDFRKVEAAIQGGFDNPIAKEYGELLNSWAYVVQFQKGKESLFNLKI